MTDRLPTYPLSAYPFRLEHPIRYADIDANHHVNNVATATLFEVGRTELFGAAGQYAANAEQTTATVLAKVTIEYRAEMHWPGNVIIATGVSRIGNASVAFHQALFSGDVCAAVCEATVVLIDKKSRRGTPLTPERRAVYETMMLKA